MLTWPNKVTGLDYHSRNAKIELPLRVFLAVQGYLFEEANDLFNCLRSSRLQRFGLCKRQKLPAVFVPQVKACAVEAFSDRHPVDARQVTVIADNLR